MRKTKLLLGGIFSLLLLALASLPALAQAPDVIKAEVNSTRIGVDDVLVLTVTLDAGNDDVGQPTLTSLDGFDFLRSSSSRQISVVNGVTSIRNVYTVQLQPLHTGVLAIGPITATVDGQARSTEPILVEVVQGSLAPPAAGSAGPGAGSPFGQGFPSLQDWFADPFSADPFALLNQMQQGGLFGATTPFRSSATPLDPALIPAELDGQDFYVSVQADDLHPYQGEQVVYTVRLFRAADSMGQITYDSPGFTGFWAAGEPEQAEYTAQAGGRSYRVTELKHVLFPAVAGAVTIDPAAFAVAGAFGSRGGTVTGEPLALDVQPLPGGAPADFGGAVGQFNIAAEVDKAETRVGDTVTQRVILAGRGNIEMLPDPVWPPAAGTRAFDARSKTEAWTDEAGRLAGGRTFERVLVPTEAGNLLLPPVAYSFFNPESGSYQTVSTEALAVDVAPDLTAGALVPLTGEPRSGAPILVNNDLRPQKESPESLRAVDKPLTDRGGYWLLWALPPALLLGQAVWQKRRQFLVANSAQLRSRKAAGKAHQALQRARREDVDVNAAAGKILLAYLSDKLHRPVAGLTWQALGDLLLARGIGAGLVTRVRDSLSVSEAGRFAPGGQIAEEGDLLSGVAQLIDDLDPLF